MIKLSAVVCTYNREQYILQALNSLKNQTLKKEEYEIIVINNNSTDDTEIICKQFEKDNPDINFIYEIENDQGLSFARNRGIKESSSPLIAFIDDDAHLDKNYFQVVVDFMFEKPEVAAIGGPIFLDYLTKEPSWISGYLDSLLGYFNKGKEQFKFTPKAYPRGSNMVFRNDTFEKIGNFNVELGRKGALLLGGEEKEIFQRIYIAELPVYYLPDAIVYHLVPEERTKADYIKKQAIGQGTGERKRAEEYGISEIIKFTFSELIKWGGSVALLFIYTFMLQPAKGLMIFRFRYWVLKGIFKK